MLKERLNEKIVNVDTRILEGYYSDKYFNITKQVLEADNCHPIVKMQVFQKNSNACICGIDESIILMRKALGENFEKLKIKALHDGDLANAYETVMTLEGDYSLFPHIETVMLGTMARRTKVATNVFNTVKEASRNTNKPVFFFPARFDIYQTQAGDGYAYDVALRALNKNSKGNGNGVSTDAQGEWWESEGLGTMPHALIAAYKGDTVKATLKFAQYTNPKVKRISLVDFDNDCVNTSLDVAAAMLRKYKETGDERYKLHGVRLDTSGNMVDKSVQESMRKSNYIGSEKPTGVNSELVRLVHQAFQREANKYDQRDLEKKFYQEIGIIVSGGFTPEKIRMFEEQNLPVSAYGVGSSMFRGNYDFTADVVQLKENEDWIDVAKVGRFYQENPKLEEVI